MNYLPDFQLLRPSTAQQAVDLRAAHAASRFLAGGTDLLPNIRRGLDTPEVLIDLSGVTEMRSIRFDGGHAVLGAGTTLSAIAEDARVQHDLPALAQAAAAVAGPTHRHAATLGGNLCLDTRCMYYNQSEPWRKGNDYCMKRGADICRVAKKSKRCFAAYSGDVAPALLVLGAAFDVLSPTGTRRIDAADFYQDDGMAWMQLQPQELLLAVQLPVEPGWHSAYEKLRVRGSIDFALAGAAVALRREGGQLADLRVALTGVASRPVLLQGLDALRGQPLDGAALERLGQIADMAASTMRTTVADPLYRRGAASVLATRLARRLWDQAA